MKKYSQQTDENECDYFFKLILLGDAGVGKSSLLLRFADDVFDKSRGATYGIDFRFKTLILNDKIVKIQIWDTAGQELYDSIGGNYIKNADGAFLIFDISNAETFHNIQAWREKVFDFGPQNRDLKTILIGHKSDLSLNRDVPYEDAKAFADDNQLDYIEVSSKLNSYVQEAFVSLVQSLIQEQERLSYAEKNKLVNDNFSKTNTCNCCYS